MAQTLSFEGFLKMPKHNCHGCSPLVPCCIFPKLCKKCRNRMYVWMPWITWTYFYQGSFKQQVPQEAGGRVGGFCSVGQSLGWIRPPAPQATSSLQAIVKAVKRENQQLKSSSAGMRLDFGRSVKSEILRTNYRQLHGLTQR